MVKRMTTEESRRDIDAVKNLHLPCVREKEDCSRSSVVIKSKSLSAKDLALCKPDKGLAYHSAKLRDIVRHE